MDDKVLRLLGLCRRAGMAAIGERAVGEAARSSRKLRLIALASDISENTEKRAISHAGAGRVELLRLRYTRNELGRALGVGECAMVGVNDAKMAENIKISAEKIKNE